jgi:hypothetical protein
MNIEGAQISIETVLLSEGGSSRGNANKIGVFYWDLNLLSEGFTLTNSELAVSRIGAVISLELSTNSALGIVPGIYIYADEIGEFKCVRAQVSKNLNEMDEGNKLIVASGVVTIIGTGMRQVIEVNLVGENGKSITASYSYCNLFN